MTDSAQTYTVDQLRKQFLDFFQTKEHKVLDSASLVPHGDPTLLLTGAGMIPFKPYFLGNETPAYSRVTTCQRCLRTPDIDNVGKTDRHGTFFEMLGNFSFGDYFKAEIIPWAWEFSTKHLQLPEDKIWASVYLDDDEAFDIWHKVVGLPKERIVRLGKEDNFWEVGVGPCGPCSELHVDRGLEYGCGSPDCKPGCDCDRFMEFWNLVFIQFHQDESGNLTPLTSKGIDTGMGLERVAALLQNVKSIFDTDIVRPVVDRIADLANTTYGDNAEHDVSLRVITDHVRGITFLVHDGVLPSNEGRGYVLRRLLRRAARHGRLLGIKDKFLNVIVDQIIDQMKVGYPEIVEKQGYIKKVIGLEEQRFHETLDQGIQLLQQLIAAEKKLGHETIQGTEAFKLYDTYGFPLELTKEIAEEHGFVVDEEGFQEQMQAQRKRARDAREDLGYIGEKVDLYKALRSQVEVEFVGYEKTELETTVVALIKDDRRVDKLAAGEEGTVVLDATPFYAESGGQVADHGTITAKKGQFSVKDVRKPVDGVVVHGGQVHSGEILVGDGVLATVYQKERWDTARHHTATHLLHRTLQNVIGDHASQKGSYVSPERLRFDFSHFDAVTPQQLSTIEQQVNEAIMKNYEVRSIETDMDTAKKMGAMALFGEKYGTNVRVITIDDYSMELCGGTHVHATGDIGLFRIVSEGSVAAGVRRIEAVAGKAALRYTDELEGILQTASSRLQTTPQSLVQQLDRVLVYQKEMEKELAQLKQEMSSNLASGLEAKVTKVGPISLLVEEVEDTDAEALRELGDKLRDRLAPAVVFLGTRQGKKVLFMSMISKSVAGSPLHAGDVVRAAAKICGGGGGGRPDMAQAGGRLPDKLPEALDTARETFLQQLREIEE